METYIFKSKAVVFELQVQADGQTGVIEIYSPCLEVDKLICFQKILFQRSYLSLQHSDIVACILVIACLCETNFK